MLNRDTVIDEAIYNCYKEMYAKSQPSVDYDQLLQDLHEGKIGKDERIYERYYLSQEEFKYILDKYIKAYKLESKWIPYMEILEDYLIKGGTKDKWIPSKDGHPGYRGYEVVKPIRDQIAQVIDKHDVSGLVSDLLEVVLNTIKDCKEFYKFDREESQFSATIALGCSPTSNPKTVKEYWKSQGVDVEIVERNPLLFWEKDYYGDNFEEIMEDEYGENWKAEWDTKWEEDKRKKEEEKSRIIEQMWEKR